GCVDLGGGIEVAGQESAQIFLRGARRLLGAARDDVLLGRGMGGSGGGGSGRAVEGSDRALCLQAVAAVCSVLDFTARALPILLERIVTLRQHLEAEAARGVADLLATQQPKAPVHV